MLLNRSAGGPPASSGAVLLSSGSSAKRHCQQPTGPAGGATGFTRTRSMRWVRRNKAAHAYPLLSLHLHTKESGCRRNLIRDRNDSARSAIGGDGCPTGVCQCGRELGDIDAPDAEPDEQLQFRFELGFGEKDVVYGDPIVETLSSMVQAIEAILPKFEKHLA